MKTNSFEVAYSTRIGLPGYSSAEIRVSRNCSLSEGEKYTETRAKVYKELKNFADSEAKIIIDSYKK